MAEEGWIDFARVLKYFRHTLEGFARDGGGGGGWEGWTRAGGVLHRY